MLVAGGFILACEWAGKRLGQEPAVRRRRSVLVGGAVLAWASITALAAASGVLREFDATPPPFALVLGLPLWALVGFQVFRLPLELLMHRAYLEGVMPVQMSYSGRNYDIVTGIAAGALGLWLWRREAPRWLVAAWNMLGSVLLVNIVTIAIASTPRFAWFGTEQMNTFVAYPPFVWLPAILVAAALIGHLLVWRRLYGHPERAE
jgi:hypothetical protein